MGAPTRARTSQGSSSSVGASSNTRSGARGELSSSSSLLPQLDKSLQIPLLDGAMQEVLSNTEENSKPVMGPPRIAASKRPAMVGSLGSRKPNLHLSLGETSQPMSRFSAFSSNEGTPSGESMRRGKSTVESPSFSRASSSPSVSNGPGSSVGTPAADSGSMSGLGIGMLPPALPSPRALNDLGPISASSSHSLLAAVTSGSSNIPSYKSSFALPPQTPDRSYLPSMGPTSSSSTSQTPARSPASTYDRTGQIGIGELSTPRWTTNVSSQGYITHDDPSGNAPTRRLADNTPTAQRYHGEGEARHARAISFSVTAPIQSNSSGSRAPPASATLSPPRHTLQQMVPSPSMPSFGPSLGGVSSLATLAHQFSDNEERERAMKAIGQSRSGNFVSRVDVDTPDYSINAMSESEDDLASNRLPRPISKGLRSPRIGDSVWADGETGPFAVASTSLKENGSRNIAKEVESSVKDNDADIWRKNFDLNSTTSDVDSVEEARRRTRRAAGLGTETDITSTRSSREEALPVSTHRSTLDPSAHQSIQARKREGSERGRNNEGAISVRRSRRTSSPSMTKTTSMARLPSSSSAQSIASAKKRSSSASIGHSLLRGSLPLGASEEFEGLLTSGDYAAEALRMLDGVGYSRRESMIRDRELSKSPHSSKQTSRPGSAGRTNTGNASRTSSPTIKHREVTRMQRDDTIGAKIPSSRRSSRSMGKAKNAADEATPSPSTAPLDSPRRLSYSSPRIKRTPLPPLPSHGVPGLASPSLGQSNLIGSTNNTSTDRSRDVSHRASGASVASSTNSTNRSLAAVAGKSNRTSDASLGDLQNGTSSALGLANTDDKMLAGMSTSPSVHGLTVPPVPPLPKAWEGTRTTSLNSIDNGSSSLSSPAVSHSTSTNSMITHNHPPEDSTTTTPGSGISKKWSFSNLGGALTTKKSEERLASKKSVAALSSHSPVTSLASPEADKTISSKRRSLAHNGVGEQSPSTSTTMVFPGSGNEQGLAVPSDGAVAPTPTTASLGVSQSPSVSTFRNRRTPSFFRKRSSDALMENSTSNLQSHRPSNERQGTDSTSASQDSNEKQRTDATTPSGGRSSRKSILTIGNMLRSASRKNIDTMPTVLPTTTKVGNSINETGEDSMDTIDSPSRTLVTPRIPSLKNIRRSSLMGRKRGKTLPSSTDPPLVPATSLPPMQVVPLEGSPASSSTSIRKPRESVLSTVSGNRSIDTPSKQQANTSSSLNSQLSSSASRERLHQDAMQMPSLPSINGTPFAKPTSLQTDRQSSGESKRGTVGEFGQPASRIPRATTFGSIKRNLTSSTSTLSTTPLKRLGASQNSSLPTSKTSLSLASHLGMSSDSEQNSMEGSLKSSSMPQDSSLSSSLGSSTLISILNAYTNAKTPAEVEVVLRRARIASQSTTTTAREKEVLVSLVTRQEQKKQSEATVETIQPSDFAPIPNIKTSRTGEAHRFDSAITPSSSAQVLAGSTSVPRRSRISMTTTSNSIRTAREASTTLSASKSSYRMSTIPSQSGQSPALSEVTTLASGNQSPSPQSNDEEREGDEEMEAYIRRRHNKRIAQGAKQTDLEKMLQFPEDEEPSKSYSHRQAEALWGDKLTDLELEEMRNFKEIYFVGQNVDKRARGRAENASSNNLGYDDDRGDYLVINHDHLAYRYEVTSLLGRGSFGQVLQCKDHKTGKSVAIKVIRNKKRFHHQALVEVKILDNLVKWDPNDEYNVIKILDSFYFRNHLCISMELLSINLYELIKANSFVGFSTKLIRRFTSQVLASLCLLRKNRVVHCDLKPENILLMHPRKSGIRVIDFGSSCFEHEKVYTYIQSRFYRSPEVILGMNYHTAIDIWSLGCIMAELYSGYPLFPGENEQEQLACIMEIFGVPDRYLVEKSSRKKLFFDSTGAPRPVVNSKGRRRRPNTKTLSSALNCNEDLFLDFLTKCLQWDPEKRIKPDAALRHPWMKRAVEVPASLPSRVSGHLPSSATSSSISGPTSRRAIFSSMTSSSSSASLSKSLGANKPSTTTSSQGTSAKIGSQGSSRTLISAPKSIRQERRISLRNNLNPNGSASSGVVNTSSPLQNNTRNQQTVS